MEPIEHARDFLNLLDEGQEQFTFQTFDDNKKRKSQSLIRILHGSIEDHYARLKELNDKGAGIFVTANRTDLKGRRIENIVKVRAVFQEDDGGGKTLPVTPHIVVQSSPGKFHRYILTDTTAVNKFGAVQETLVALYGSDPNAKDVSRVLRVPGFNHMKGDAHPVKVVEQSNEPPLAWEEVKQTFPPVVQEKEPVGQNANEGERNHQLARLAGKMLNTIKKKDVITFCLGWNQENNPPLSNREVVATVESVAKTHDRKKTEQKLSSNLAPDLANDGNNLAEISFAEHAKPIAEMVREFISNGGGKFTANEVAVHVSARDRGERQCIYTELNRLKEDNKIKKLDNLNNAWEAVEPEIEDMNLSAAEAEPVSVPLPLGISDIAHVYPGSIILFAGASNAGKTALLLTILDKVLSGPCLQLPFIKIKDVKGSEPHPTGKNIRYLNCEMDAGELRQRLGSFGTRSIEEWTDNVSFKERHGNFHQLVLPDGLTFIDYLDVTEDFFEAPHLISQIHERLDTGIAIVSMQKAPDKKFAVGGSQTLAKPRLVVNLDSNEQYGMIAKLIKVKQPVDFRSKPQGKEIDFQIAAGCSFEAQSGWRYVNENQRKQINRDYQKQLNSGDNDIWVSADNPPRY